MAVHVKDGTPFSGVSLCDTCTRAHVARGYSVSDKIVVCRAVEPAHRVRFSVRDCSDYIDRTRQNLWEMERIAWVIAPRGPKRKAGFRPPPDTETEQQVELILEHDED